MDSVKPNPMLRNTERTLIYVSAAFLLLLIVWKAPSIEKQYQAKGIIDNIYDYAPLNETFTRHPGYVCAYLRTEYGGNKSVDLYTCQLPDTAINAETPLALVYVRDGKIIDHVIESNDQKYMLNVKTADN